MRVKLKDLALTLNGAQIVSFTTSADFRDYYDLYKDKELELSLKVYKPKRSRNANDYMWVLCERLAENQGIGAVEVYRHAIKEVGVYEPLPIREDALEKFSAAWGSKGLGWFCEVIDDSFPGYKKVHAFYGSSTYDSKEMSRLIDYIVQDCKALGIETATQAELALLIEDWGNRNAKHS